VIVGGVGAGVARPQDASQGLAGAITTVQVGQQRVEPEAALVGPSRTLLWRVRLQQRAVHIDDQEPLDRGTRPPGRCSSVGAGRAQAGEPVGVTGDPLHHPPRRRCGGDRAEQLRLLTQDGKITQAVAPVGHHHRKIPQHRARVVPVPRGLATTYPPRKRPGQPQPVGQLTQQRRPGMPGDPITVAGDLEPHRRLGSLHPQGALLVQGM
jgi:hypothetical protein